MSLHFLFLLFLLQIYRGAVSLSIACFFVPFFSFLVIDTCPPYCDYILSLLESLNNLYSDRSRYRERLCSSVSTQSAMLNSSRHLPLLEGTVCQCHSVGGTFYSLPLSFESSCPELLVHLWSILVFPHYILLRMQLAGLLA